MRSVDRAIFNILRRMPVRKKPEAEDEEVWRSDEDGRHFKIETETGEIKAGFGGKLNGQKVRPKGMRNQPVTANGGLKAESDALKTFESAAEGARNKVEFWMNMTEEQQSEFMKSGLKLDDVFEKLKKESESEWKTPNPGSAKSFSIEHDYSDAPIEFEENANPKSDGWMAEASRPGIISIRKGGLGDAWKEIMAHEAGHQLSNLSPELARTIMLNPNNILGRYNTRLMKFDGVYGEYSPEEAFATCVSNYVLYPEHFREKYPETFEAIDNLFKASPSAKGYVDRVLESYEHQYRKQPARDVSPEIQEDGGKGSGNFNHAGRPGQRGGSASGGGLGGTTVQPSEHEPSLEELMADLWGESEEPKKPKGESAWEKEEKERSERESYGQNGLLESEYPERLRLSKEEQKELYNVLRSYRDDRWKGDVSRDLMDALNGFPESALKQREEQYKKQLKEAEEMIKQRKAEGYSYKEQHPEKGYERKAAWWRYYQEHGEAPDAIGERGIKHWQTQRKEAEKRLNEIELAKKVAKRNEYAKGNANYMAWRNSPNAENTGYTPWAEDVKTYKARAIDRVIYKHLTKLMAKDTDPDIEDGGPGSGNWGHKGRPGLVGGSGKGGGSHYRGGRADMGEYFGSRRDWLNGLNGERQREVTNTLKLWGSGDTKKGERLIMQGDNPLAKEFYIKALAESRNWDKNYKKLWQNLSPEEFGRLSSLESNVYMYNGLDKKLDAAKKTMTERGFNEYLDLLSKAMGGETSGRNEEPKKPAEPAKPTMTYTPNDPLVETLCDSWDYLRQQDADNVRIALRKIVGVEGMDKPEGMARALTELSDKAYASAENLRNTKYFLGYLGRLKDYDQMLEKGQDELCKANVEMLKKYDPGFVWNPNMGVFDISAVDTAEKMMEGKAPLSELQEYLSNKFKILGGKGLEPREMKPQADAGLIRDLKNLNVVNNPPKKLDKEPTDEEIISRVSGGDKTKGSCASVCLAYMANKYGFDVRDFRGGDSRSTFAMGNIIRYVLDGYQIKYDYLEEYNGFTGASKLVSRMEDGKEYMACFGSHAAMVRKNGKTVEYLELQAPKAEDNGWKTLNRDALKTRWGCKQSRTFAYNKVKFRSMLVDPSTLTDKSAFAEIAGYFNTAEGEEMKGAGGSVR